MGVQSSLSLPVQSPKVNLKRERKNDEVKEEVSKSAKVEEVKALKDERQRSSKSRLSLVRILRRPRLRWSSKSLGCLASRSSESLFNDTELRCCLEGCSPRVIMFSDITDV